ncbi:MAG: hypothetical protein LIP77_00455, partial [Planctomycetes bacterium]|nr:hypothetical protein [Planctomycetota bacterium]
PLFARYRFDGNDRAYWADPQAPGLRRFFVGADGRVRWDGQEDDAPPPAAAARPALAPLPDIAAPEPPRVTGPAALKDGLPELSQPPPAPFHGKAGAVGDPSGTGWVPAADSAVSLPDSIH